MNNDVYAAALAEIDEHRVDKGTWARAFAESGGDESKAKALYIKARAASINGSIAWPDTQPPVEDVPKKRVAPETSSGKAITAIRVILVVLGVGVALIAFDRLYVERKTQVSEKPSEVQQPTQPAEKTVSAPEPKPPAAAPKQFNSSETNVYVDSEKRINITGKITPATAAHVNYLMQDDNLITIHGRLMVMLNSRGGDLYSAMEIGRALRKKAPTDLFVSPGNDCFSSCVFVYAAGSTRASMGRVGIHRPYSVMPTDNLNETALTFEKMSADARAYFKEMRVSEALWDEMVRIPPDQIRIFQSSDDMVRYGLIYSDPVDAEVLVAKGMKKYGISDRQVYMQRQAITQQQCEITIPNWQQCYDQVMSGG